MSNQAHSNLIKHNSIEKQIASFDWATTSLGASQTWPAELKTAVTLMLSLHTPIAVYAGPDLVLLYNNAFSRVLGDRHPYALGQPAQRVFADVWQTAEPVITAAMRGECKNTDVNQHVNGPDEPWINGRFTVLPSADNAIIAVMHSMSDTTYVLGLQEALHASNEHSQFLKRALSHMGDYVFVWDREKKFVYANERLESLWGLSKNDYRGKSMAEIHFPPAVEKLIEGQVDHVMATGESVSGITPYTSPSGKEGHFEYFLNPLIGADGRVQFVAGVSRDVSERQRSGEALRKSEQRYRTLFESIDEGFCVFQMIYDPQGNPVDYRWLETNPAFERHTGLINATGRTARELVPNLEPHWPEIYGKIARTGVQQRFVEHSPAMGRWFEVDAFRIGDPEECKVALLFADITRRKESERALQEADQRKDEFLATLAHELRNPLAAIRSGIEILKLAQNDPSVQISADPYQTMERQTQQLVSLVDDLLEVSRITRGTLELRRTRVTLAEVITSATESCQPLLNQADHALTLNLPERPIVLEADPNRLAQVLANLLNNAAKYTPAGGHIWVSAKEHEGEAVVTVKDSGIGIPADRLDHIFEMFVQIDGAQDNSNQGLGVGLALAKSLVEMHGGKIGVTSGGPGKGSTFNLRLPLPEEAPAMEVEIMQPEAPVISASRYRVLVVDDNTDAASTLGMLIEMLGHDVKTADGGLQAIALAEAFRPQVIFMDLGMPEMDGFAAAQRIRQQLWGSDVLIVALSGWGQAEDKRKTREAGFDYHLVKPAELAELKQVLARLDDTSAAET